MSQAPDNNRAELEAEACYFSARVLEIEAHAIAMHAPVDSPEPEYLRALDLGGHDMRNLAPPTTLANLYQYPVDWRDVRQRSTCGLPNLPQALEPFPSQARIARLMAPSAVPLPITVPTTSSSETVATATNVQAETAVGRERSVSPFIPVVPAKRSAEAEDVEESRLAKVSNILLNPE
ncbi:MAG: hypothetical protein LQ350_005265 [Teloschistes chrysophthalmus]|nr:MAG: hypothetical protein LQ350_005265 [Niorma chrysophthalma]